MPPIEDFIRDRAEPVAAPAPRPARPARQAAPEDDPAMSTGTIGQTIDNILQVIEQAGPEVMRWAQEVSTLPAEMKSLREQLDRIEALLTRPEVK